MNTRFINESEIMKIFLDDSRFSKIKAKEVSNINSVREEKMKNTYNKDENKKYFESNENVYNDYLTKILSDFESQKENNNYFSQVFKNLDIYCVNNGKTFSQLKHLCYDLSELLGKTSNVIHRIAGVYNKFIAESNSLYNKIHFKRDEQVDLIHKKLKVGLYEWGSQLLTQKKFVIDNLAGFYHFKKHEYASFSKLINFKLEGNNKLRSSLEAITKKKMKLFQSKDIKSWGMNKQNMSGININEIFKDFDIAKVYMLPEQTEKLKKEQRMNNFLNKHVLFEYLNFYTMSQYYIEINFTEFTDKMMNSFNKDDLMWNIFNAQDVDIAYFDRESTFTLKSKV